MDGAQQSLAQATRISKLLDCLNASTHPRNLVHLNPIANSFAASESPNATAALNYAALLALIAQIKAGYTAAGRLRCVVRVHQPTATANGTNLSAYHALVRAGAGVDFDGVADVSTLAEFDDYLTSSDWGNTTFYDSAGVHAKDAGQDLWSPIVEAAWRGQLAMGNRRPTMRRRLRRARPFAA